MGGKEGNRIKTEATFTRDRTGTVPNQTGLDRLPFTRDRSEPVRNGTKIVPVNKQIQF